MLQRESVRIDDGARARTDGCSEILKIMLRNEKLADDVDLKKLAEETPSFSGSDLKREWPSFAMTEELTISDLCVSAAFAAIKEKLIVPWKKLETPASVTASGKSASHASKDSGGSGGSGPSTDPMVIDVPSEPPASPSKKKVLPTTAKASNEDDNANVKRTVRHYADGTSATITERKLSSRKPSSTDEKPKCESCWLNLASRKLTRCS
jgi:SpoVK/Ycf46/Vps4 family AAA+-type ATPase